MTPPPSADTDIDTLIRRADLARYTAKRRGRGTSVYWSPELEPAETQPLPAATPSGAPSVTPSA